MTTPHDIPTPALVADLAALSRNLEVMAAVRPGPRLRPHVKAHKCTALAKIQAAQGHHSFTCATVREVLELAEAGLRDDLLLANEVLDTERLRGVEARITLAVDSPATIDAAARTVKEVVIDVDVGLRRCGCKPEDAGRLADSARSKGLRVRGVMGYEGHAVHVEDRARRTQLTAESMARLARAHAAVGGEVISAGGTGTFDCNELATEIQAGSYALMDAQYAQMTDLPFKRAAYVLATVVHASADRAVVDCGLKALGMDQGPPTIDGAVVLSVTDEHTTFRSNSNSAYAAGDRIAIWPAHIDPTVAYHERIHVVEGDAVQACWPIDLRGW